MVLRKGLVQSGTCDLHLGRGFGRLHRGCVDRNFRHLERKILIVHPWSLDHIDGTDGHHIEADALLLQHGGKRGRNRLGWDVVDLQRHGMGPFWQRHARIEKGGGDVIHAGHAELGLQRAAVGFVLDVGNIFKQIGIGECQRFVRIHRPHQFHLGILGVPRAAEVEIEYHEQVRGGCIVDDRDRNKWGPQNVSQLEVGLPRGHDVIRFLQYPGVGSFHTRRYGSKHNHKDQQDQHESSYIRGIVHLGPP